MTLPNNRRKFKPRRSRDALLGCGTFLIGKHSGFSQKESCLRTGRPKRALADNKKHTFKTSMNSFPASRSLIPHSKERNAIHAKSDRSLRLNLFQPQLLRYECKIRPYFETCVRSGKAADTFESPLGGEHRISMCPPLYQLRFT
jgi:hypothetical protein